ncbi:MAG: SpoIIIAH-like family protein [Oscillospiraceae bacterium]|nr:SpoIIIAH-like family protein [Oscillospiraceae bacterium]
MKMPNAIIGKKQIILAGLTLILGLGIYINYVSSSNDGEIKATGKVDGVNVNYGESQLVNSQTDDYFAQARLDKMNSRDEAVETLKVIMTGGDSTEEEIEIATEKAASVSALIESENQIESLIKAAGFEDCVVYLDGENANIVVKSEGLQANQAAQIKDILLSEVDVLNENIRIFDVN